MTGREWRRWMGLADHILREPDVSPLVCPNCGATAIASRFVGGGPQRLGYGAIWCNTCLHGVWLSRLTIPEGIPMIPIEDDPATVGIPNFQQVSPLDE